MAFIQQSRSGQLSALALCLLLSGCGGAEEGIGARLPVYKVTGKVTLSGGPLVSANVAFAPLDGQPVAIGRTNDAGEYSLTTYDPGDGAALGKYKVVISKPLSAGGSAGASSAHSNDPGADFSVGHDVKAGNAGNAIPEEYTKSDTTRISKTVEKKDNVINIEIP